jgi:hypothetical protein
MRRTIVHAGIATAVAVTLAGPVVAGPKPKPITKTVDYTDATPDPSGNAESGNAAHCNGVLPTQEKGITFAAPAAGSLKAVLSGFQGDWSMQIRDAKGKILGGDDVNPPAYESVTVKIKSKGSYVIFPCNLAGTPLATVKYTFTFK